MELIWRETYEHAVELFGGQRPGTQLEADLVERFEHSPAALVAAVDKLGERFASGRIHSPWPLLLRELEQAPDRDAIRASDEGDRAKQVHLAERYIANAGLFLPELELVDELFGARGRLRHWPELQAHMLELWQARQPDAERVDVERVERAERWKAGQLAMQAIGTMRTVPHDDAQPQHSSQTSTALTAVSAHTSTLDVDADIVW